MGRITQSTNSIPVADGSASSGQVTAECFSYDKFNRLKAAWTVAAAPAPTCGTAAPASGAAGWDASTTAYQAIWQYSAAGKITQLSQSLAAGAAVTSTYGYADVDHPAAVTSATTATGTDSFTYDDAGRMVSRTVNGVTTDLTWDVTSSLVESGKSATPWDITGRHTVYAYDVSGQRVLQATAAQRFSPGTAVAYTPAGQVEDADTSATTVGDVTGTRYYTFGGATVAVRTHDGNLALVLGDEQGSVSVTMPVTLNPDGTMASATVADAQAVTRTSYTPYGQLRGADNLALDRGWLGQVEDRADATTGTGLTYLNARYYDPVLARFITPDPLMNPADPKTLDPYRYADNNPVVFTDVTGLAPNKISDDDAYRKAAPTVAKKTAAVVAVKKATGQMPSSANPGGGKKPSSSAPTPCHSFACGGSLNASQTAQASTSVGACEGWNGAAGCASTVADHSLGQVTSWLEGRIRKDGSYKTPPGTQDWVKSLTKVLFGKTGRQAVTTMSHLDSLGGGFLVLGTAASLIDSYNHLEDIGVRQRMSAWEIGAYAVGRTMTGSIFASLAELAVLPVATQASAAAGSVCGEAVLVCATAVDAVIVSGAGIAGDMAGTWFWDRSTDGFLRQRYGDA